MDRIHAAEASGDFIDAFEKSMGRRKRTKKEIAEYRAIQKSTENKVEEWRVLLTDEDIQRALVLEKAAAQIESARQRGFRTPHK